MPLYLCGESALEMWRHVRVDDFYEPYHEPRNVCRKSAITDAVHTKHQLNQLSTHAERLLECIPRPYHVLVTSHDERWDSQTLHPHVWSAPLPRGTFVDLGGEVYLSSGPFLFLQLAAEHELPLTVKLGLELCGIYSLFAHRESSEPTDPRETLYRSKTGVDPATSVARISRFLERCTGQRGHRAAETAAKYLLDHSGSPMESAAYMFGCLPKRYGGHGIKKPEFNLTLNVVTKDGTRQRRPDLYWRGRSVDVEYNSDEIHLAKEQYYKDAKRQVELTASNVRVLPLTRDDVVYPENFDRFAFGLAKVLGVRLRAYPENWKEKRKDLRQAVFWGR